MSAAQLTDDLKVHALHGVVMAIFYKENYSKTGHKSRSSCFVEILVEKFGKRWNKMEKYS